MLTFSLTGIDSEYIPPQNHFLGNYCLVYFSNMMAQPRKRETSDPESNEPSTGKRKERPSDYELCTRTSEKVIKLYKSTLGNGNLTN